MITEIPSAAEFHKAGLDLLHLAWGIAVEPDFDFAHAADNGFDGDAEAVATYWDRVQPRLGNGFGMIQQAMELALKGRIAAVSPYLLISRDPKAWPAGVDTKSIPFSEFHTLDAADLVKVHNAVAPIPLNDDFAQFFDTVRRQRNALMHSVPKQNFVPATLLRTLLTAAEQLFGEKPWVDHLIAYSLDNSASVIGANYSHERNGAMLEVEVALRNLTPAVAKRFFAFDKKRRAYLCPSCHDHAYTKSGSDLPRLAQLVSKTSGETKLKCTLCGTVSEVERAPCTSGGCNGDVIGKEMCLTCFDWQ